MVVQQQQQDAMDLQLAPRPPMHVMTRRGMPPRMQHLLHALSGSDSRPPLIYTGDVGASLERLRSDLHTHHSELCSALGEPQRPEYPAFPGLQPLLESSPGMPSTLLDYNITSGGPYGLTQLGSTITSHALGSTPAHSSSFLSSQLQAFSSAGRPGPYPSTANYQPPMLGWHAGGSLSARDARDRHYPGTIAPPYHNPGRHYQPPAPSHAQFPGSRMSEFAIRAPTHLDPGSLFVAESSSFMWPPVGATFDGQRSQAIAQVNPIDSLSDLAYRKKKMSTFEELASDSLSGAAVRRHHMQAKDQIDIFLSDYVKGGSKPAVSYDSYGSTYAQGLDSELSRFAAGRGTTR